MKKLSKYLLWAFGVAWVFQIIACVLYRKGNSMGYSVLLALHCTSCWFLMRLIQLLHMSAHYWEMKDYPS